MKHTQKYIDNSTDKKYYEYAFSKLTDQQREELESLVIRFENAGAKNPLNWAFSEVKENLPQFGRFLVLKNLFDISKAIEDNISMAEDFDDTFKEKFSEIKEIAGEKKLFDFLKLYSRGLIYNVVGILDEGNLESNRDNISWALMETDENFELTGQMITGLHESFLGFENEIK